MDGFGVAIIAINKIKVYMYFRMLFLFSTTLLTINVIIGVLSSKPVNKLVEIMTLIVSYTDKFSETISLSVIM